MDLQSNPAFKYLDATELESFVASCNVVELPAGSELISYGEQGEHVYFLLDGQLSVRLPKRPREQELTRLEPPAVVGEVAMLTGQPRIASIVTITAAKLLAIGIETFQEKIADGDPAALKVVGNMARVLAHRLGAMLEKLLELETAVPEERAVELQQFRSLLFSKWST